MPEPETMTVVPDVSEVNEAGWKWKVPSLLDTVFGGYSNVQVENNLCRLNARSHHVKYVLVDKNVRTIFSSTMVVTKNRFTLSSLADFLKARLDILRLIRGKPCTIQGTDSDTLLHIPAGVYTALLGNIHTDPSKFRHHIPPNDCLVAPICEYHLQPFIGRILPRNTSYKIQVPHIIRNTDEAQKHIYLRHGDLHGNAVLPVCKFEKDKFEIDEKYVTIHSRHFSGYIVTAEGINCCSKSANVLLFGSLTNNLEMGPLVTVKIYLASIHSHIKDYEMVIIVYHKINTM